MSSALSNVWCSLLAKQPSKECEFDAEIDPRPLALKWDSQEDVAQLPPPPHYLQLMSLAAQRAQKTRFSRGNKHWEKGPTSPDVESEVWPGISLRILRICFDLLRTSDPKHLLLLLLQTVSHSHADSQRKFVSFFFATKKVSVGLFSSLVAESLCYRDNFVT